MGLHVHSVSVTIGHFSSQYSAVHAAIQMQIFLQYNFLGQYAALCLAQNRLFTSHCDVAGTLLTAALTNIHSLTDIHQALPARSCLPSL